MWGESVGSSFVLWRVLGVATPRRVCSAVITQGLRCDADIPGIRSKAVDVSWLAEDAARELPTLRLEDALQVVHLYAERGSPKYEKAAMRGLERNLMESQPRLQHVAEIVASLAERAD
jgi:hypothetical protein